jgi:hypothetical protein
MLSFTQLHLLQSFALAHVREMGISTTFVYLHKQRKGDSESNHLQNPGQRENAIIC